MVKETLTWFGKFNKNNPRVVMLVIFIILSIPTFIMGDKYVKVYKEEYEETKKELIKRSEDYKASAETWKTKYEQIKSKSKTVKIIKPDGTITETTETELESDTSVTERIKEEMEAKIQEERTLVEQRLEKKFEKILKERKKLLVEIGVTVPEIEKLDGGLEYYAHLNYTFIGPFSVGGYIKSTREIGVGVGFSF